MGLCFCERERTNAQMLASWNKVSSGGCKLCFGMWRLKLGLECGHWFELTSLITSETIINYECKFTYSIIQVVLELLFLNNNDNNNVERPHGVIWGKIFQMISNWLLFQPERLGSALVRNEPQVVDGYKYSDKTVPVNFVFPFVVKI